MPIRKRGSNWYVDVQIGNRRVKRSLGKGASRAEAAQLENAIRTELSQNRRAPKRRLAEKAMILWMENHAKQLKSLTKIASHLSAIQSDLKGKYLDELPEVARDITVRMQKQGLSNATINRRLAIIRRVLNLAYKKWGWLETKLGDRIQMLPEHNQRHIYLTPNDIEHLATSCKNPNVADVIRLAAFTGLRYSELMGLTQSHIVDGAISLGIGTKTNRPRIIPVPDHIQPILKKIPLPVTNAQVRRNWEQARKATGLTHIRFHDLRHTYASWLLQIANASLIDVRDLLGHATVATTNRYVHLQTSHLKTVTARLSQAPSRDIPDESDT